MSPEASNVGTLRPVLAVEEFSEEVDVQEREKAGVI